LPPQSFLLRTSHFALGMDLSYPDATQRFSSRVRKPMSLTSATLLQRLRDPGDSDAWDQLVRLYTPLIRRWLGQHIRQQADVDDLAQHVLTVVVEKLPAFQHNGQPGAFRTWLRTICVNRLRMFWRTRPGTSPDPEPILRQLEDPHSDLSRRWD